MYYKTNFQQYQELIFNPSQRNKTTFIFILKDVLIVIAHLKLFIVSYILPSE